MAIYHCSVKPVQRSKGHSSTAAAAYRAGEKIEDQRTRKEHDYTARRGVLHTALIGWSGSRGELWNAAEVADKRKDSTTAKEYEVALPDELTFDQQVALAEAYGKYLREQYGCAVDIAVHAPDGGGDQRNTHAHILTTTRPVMNDLLGKEKCIRDWADKKRGEAGLPGRAVEVYNARKAWADIANEHLAAAGHDVRIDHRSNEARGIPDEPSIHLGPVATAMERRAAAAIEKNPEAEPTRSDRGDINRDIIVRNDWNGRELEDRIEKQIGQAVEKLVAEYNKQQPDKLDILEASGKPKATQEQEHQPRPVMTSWVAKREQEREDRERQKKELADRERRNENAHQRLQPNKTAASQGATSTDLLRDWRERIEAEEKAQAAQRLQQSPSYAQQLAEQGREPQGGPTMTDAQKLAQSGNQGDKLDMLGRSADQQHIEREDEDERQGPGM